MIIVPEWVRSVVSKITCTHCKAKQRLEGIFAQGIMEFADDGEDQRLVFFYQYHCHKCHKSSQNVLNSQEVSLESYITDLMEIHSDLEEEEDFDNDIREIENIAKPIKSKISDKEVELAKKIIAKATSHEDFLLKIGMTREEIEKYRKEKQ